MVQTGAIRPLRRTSVLLAALLAVVAGCLVAAAPAHAATPVQSWLAQPRFYIAHRGGDADWPEGSYRAYRQSAAWNPDLALEIPVRRSKDGVWVVSEDADTARVFGTRLVIASSTWSQLSTLRSKDGGLPMSRLEQTILKVVEPSRVLFVDDKDDANVDALLDLLDRYGGSSRTIAKSDGGFRSMPARARARGYTTWGYFYPSEMSGFAANQGKYDLLGISYAASASDYATMKNTGKRLTTFICATADQARLGLAKGATGVMASGVIEVVPRG